MLIIKNLHKSFLNNEVLSNVNFTLGSGEILAITGNSGVGKTTLLKIISGEIKDYEGECYFTENEKISMVFQENLLFENRTVYENLKFVCEKSYEELKISLESLLLYEILDKKVLELSGGQKRRVAFLRAFLAPYDVILLDEAIREVDSESEEKMLKYIEKNLNGSLIFVTHNRNHIERLHAREVKI